MAASCSRSVVWRWVFAFVVTAVGASGCGRDTAPRTSAPASSQDGVGEAAAVARPAFPPPGDGEAEREAAAIRDEVFAEAEELVRLEPQSAEATCLLAAVHRRYGDPEGARRLLERALVLDPGDADAHRQLAEAAIEVGDDDSAEPHLRAALAADPGALDLAGQLAETLARRGDLAAAVELLDAFLLAHPDVAAAWTTLGKARVKLGDPAAARSAFERALAIDPVSREAHHGLGRLLQSLGDDEGARPHLREVVRLDDENARTHRERAGADAASPREWSANARHRIALVHATRGDLARAERGWLRALELDPDNAAAREMFAVLLSRTGRHAEALAARRAWCDRSPDDPAGWFALAQCALSAERPAIAEEALDRLLALDADHPAGTALLARAVAPRDPDRALALARRAVDLAPDAANHYVLADMLLRSGNRDEAIRALERACELAPDDPRYRATLGRVRGGR